jgi:hypothetical protein
LLFFGGFLFFGSAQAIEEALSILPFEVGEFSV